MAKRDDPDKLSELLGSFNGELLSEIPQHFNDDSIKVERLLLDMVRPDPIQPRRILPDRIHHEFHDGRLTPSQALRELVQIAQVAARQRGHPFKNLLELLPDPDRDEEDIKLTPEETLLKELITLAVTIHQDGQVNPITVVDMTHGVTRLYRIETGERRYWAGWLLKDFLQGFESDGMIDCIVVPADRSSVFRQAKENTARRGLSAIAMARQAALLLLTVNGYEIPAYAVTNDFYRQALELRIPRGTAQEIYAAMGGVDKAYFSYIKKLLLLCDEAMELADRHNLDEGVLRSITGLAPEDQIEMVQQIIQFGLSGKQVEKILHQDEQTTNETGTTKFPKHINDFVMGYSKHVDDFESESLWKAFLAIHRDEHLTHAFLMRLGETAFAAARNYKGQK
ncbi:MAG: ParB N-terminal domain-containing protein [Anaerolineaceae bacterium]|nr:ParB N-terminal domain-containing protein [Anaerolineaceae bacterium]